MRTLASLILAAGLAASVCSVFAEPPPASGGQPVSGVQVPPAEEPAVKPIAVPDGPVVNRQELEGGLILEDIVIGTGPEVKAGGAVVAHYHGTLKADGKVFDSSFERGEPAAFPLNGVIEGWSKGVPGMRVGGVRRLTIPSAMGYGERGSGPNIPPNSDLVFTIQLEDALTFEDVKEGTGEGAGPTFFAVTAFKITDAEGKVVEEASADNPYIWLPGEYQGIGFGLSGMKVGGKRIIKVPAEMNLTSPSAPQTRPNKVPVTIEVELLGLRNWNNQRR